MDILMPFQRRRRYRKTTPLLLTLTVSPFIVNVFSPPPSEYRD